jgi:hypothetical protein
MSPEIIIPREKNFKLNAGHFRAKIPNVTLVKAKRSDDMNCCINFDVQVPGMERYECCARAVFPIDLSTGSALRTFLEGLLGCEFFSEHSGQSINLGTILRGLDCDIEIVHGPHNEEKYDWPMVLVKSAAPVKSTKDRELASKKEAQTNTESTKETREETK